MKSKYFPCRLWIFEMKSLLYFTFQKPKENKYVIVDLGFCTVRSEKCQTGVEKEDGDG